jgi:dihydrofolate reductase
LLRDGLVDELHLMIHPVVVGRGAKLFEGGEQHPLELIDSKKFGTGVVYAIYTPQPNRNGGGS